MASETGISVTETGISVAGSVKVIGHRAFQGCPSLKHTQVAVPQSACIAPDAFDPHVNVRVTVRGAGVQRGVYKHIQVKKSKTKWISLFDSREACNACDNG